jgi:hypothetical protein
MNHYSQVLLIGNNNRIDINNFGKTHDSLKLRQRNKQGQAIAARSVCVAYFKGLSTILRFCVVGMVQYVSCWGVGNASFTMCTH